MYPLCFPPGPPATVSPATTSRRTPHLGYGTAVVNRRRQPECLYYPGPGRPIYPARSSPSLRLLCSLSPPPLPDPGLLVLETRGVSGTVSGRLKCTSSSSSMVSTASACFCNLAASRCDFRRFFFAADLTITTWQSFPVLKNT